MSELATAGRWLLMLMLRYTFVVVVYFVVVMKKDDSPQLKLLSSICIFPRTVPHRRREEGAGKYKWGNPALQIT